MAYTWRVTPISRKSCTRSTVASTSFVCWSKTRIFHTGGPDGVETFNVGALFEGADVVGLLGSTGWLRLSKANNALVCDCCSVGGALTFGMRYNECDVD